MATTLDWLNRKKTLKTTPSVKSLADTATRTTTPSNKLASYMSTANVGDKYHTGGVTYTRGDDTYGQTAQELPTVTTRPSTYQYGTQTLDTTSPYSQADVGSTFPFLNRGSATSTPVTDLPEVTLGGTSSISPYGDTSLYGDTALTGEVVSGRDFGTEVDQTYSPYMDYLRAEEARLQAEYDAEKTRQEGLLTQQDADIEQRYEDLYAPSFSQIARDAEVNKETAMRYAGAAGSARGSRAMEEQIQIQDKADEMERALQAEKLAAIEMAKAQARGESADALEAYSMRLSSAKDAVRGKEEEMALLKQGLTEESLRIAAEEDQAFRDAMSNFYAEQGIAYNPFTGETGQSIEGLKTLSEITENEAQSAKIWDAINNPEKNFQYFTDELGGTSVVITDSRGGIETMSLGKLGAAEKYALEMLGAGGGLGMLSGTSGGYSVSPGYYSSGLSSAGFTGTDGMDPVMAQQLRDAAATMIEAEGGFEGMTQGKFNELFLGRDDMTRAEMARYYGMSLSDFDNLSRAALDLSKEYEAAGQSHDTGGSFSGDIWNRYYATPEKSTLPSYSQAISQYSPGTNPKTVPYLKENYSLSANTVDGSRIKKKTDSGNIISSQTKRAGKVVR